MKRMMATVFCAMASALAWMPFAQAQGDGSAASRIEVSLGDVSQMREVKHLRGTQQHATTRSIEALAEWLKQQAERSLPADRSLQVTLRDVDLAGEYEPGRTDMYDIRVVKDIYPPRIELDYRLGDASGALLREGEATLRDIGFLHGATPVGNDTLRYEKRMLRDWLRSLSSVQDGT